MSSETGLIIEARDVEVLRHKGAHTAETGSLSQNPLFTPLTLGWTVTLKFLLVRQSPDGNNK